LQLKAPGRVMEVLIGPLAPAGGEEMISEFLRTQGYPGGIPTRRSAMVL